jgi:hypothetical protein
MLVASEAEGRGKVARRTRRIGKVSACRRFVRCDELACRGVFEKSLMRIVGGRYESPNGEG